MRSLRKIGFVFRSGGRHFLHAPKQSAAAILVLILMICVLAGTALLARAVVRTLSLLEERIAIVVYIKPETGPYELAELRKRIEADERVIKVDYVSPEEALSRLRSQGGRQAEVLSNLDKNPLPPSLEVRPRSADIASALSDALEKEPLIDDVVSETDIVEKLALISRILLAITSATSLALVTVAMLVVGNTLRLSIYARRKEIAAMHLLGASDALILSPFVFEGMITAILGTVGGAGVWLIIAYFVKDGGALARIFPLAPSATFVALLWGALGAFSLLITALSAYVAARGYLRRPRGSS